MARVPDTLLPSTRSWRGLSSLRPRRRVGEPAIRSARTRNFASRSGREDRGQRSSGPRFRVRPSGMRAALLGGGVEVALKILGRRLDELGVSTTLGFADGATAAAASDFPARAWRRWTGRWGPTARCSMRSRPRELRGRSMPAFTDARRREAGRRRGSSASSRWRRGMGCGNGSCNGCVVPVLAGGYARSCVEGPVFSAEVLAW